MQIVVTGQQHSLYSVFQGFEALTDSHFISFRFSEVEAAVDDIYQTYKRSKLAENSKASKLREFLSQFKTHKQSTGYKKDDILRIFKDD